MAVYLSTYVFDAYANATRIDQMWLYHERIFVHRKVTERNDICPLLTIVDNNITAKWGWLSPSEIEIKGVTTQFYTPSPKIYRNKV